MELPQRSARLSRFKKAVSKEKLPKDIPRTSIADDGTVKVRATAGASSPRKIPTAQASDPCDGKETDTSSQRETTDTQEAGTCPFPYVIPICKDAQDSLVRYSAREKAYVSVDNSMDLDVAPGSGRQTNSRSQMTKLDKSKGHINNLDNPRTALSFVHRKVQTIHGRLKSTATTTPTTKIIDASVSCSVWEINNSEKKDQQITSPKHDASLMEGNAGRVALDDLQLPFSIGANKRLDGNAAPKRVVKVIERMLTQNMSEDVTTDFKYWEDPSDNLKNMEGSLLPLWKFPTPQITEASAITALICHPHHSDMFAAAYGTFDPSQQFIGAVRCKSLLHPLQNESEVFFESVPLSLAFHPEYDRLLAVGCANGSVNIVDLRSDGDCNGRIVSSSKIQDRHKDAVWAVSWSSATFVPGVSAPETASLHATRYGQRTLLSTSADGTVVRWEVRPSDTLKRSIVIPLKGTDEADGFNTAATCMAINPQEPSAVAVGTEGGEFLTGDLEQGSGKTTSILHQYFSYDFFRSLHHS